MSRKQRDVFLAFAQRRHHKGNHVQTVKKILTEVPLGDFFLQVFVGRSNHAHVDGDGVVASHRNKSLLFQGTQYFGLRLQTHVSDFIQKQGSAISLLKLAFFVRRRPRKRRFAMPEELAVDQVFWNRGAVHLDKHFIFARALHVDGVRDQFLAGARLAVDQHATVGGRHQRNLLAKRLHGNTVTHDHALRLQLLPQVAILMAQPPCFDRVFYQDERLFQRERLFRKIVGAQLGGAHSRLDGPVARDHDDLRWILKLADPLQHFQPIDSGQPHIQQDQVEAAFAQQLQTVFAARADAGFVSFVLENAAQGFADTGFVIDDQDVCHDLA